jgi:nucleotide-binding universal stress UspA family protein
MRPFQTILFAADFSGNSREAFRCAGSLAVAGAARLHVLHVLEPDWVPEEPAGLGQPVQFYDAETDGGRDEALQRKLRATYAPDHPVAVEYHARHGQATTEILRLAEEVRADLIVTGTHGRTGLSWLLTGSVATSVLHRAHCPVLVVRSSGHQPLPGAPRIVLHPTDFSDASEGALRVARWLARDLGAQLVILHVASGALFLSEMVVPVDPQVDREALEDLRQLVDGPDLKFPVEVRLGRGEAADEILRTARDLECGLIVMGTHGRTGLGRLFMGSVAEYVLPRSDCPVLAVKTPQGRSTPTDPGCRPHETGISRRGQEAEHAGRSKSLVPGG